VEKSKMKHAQDLGISFSAYKIAYDRGWSDAMSEDMDVLIGRIKERLKVWQGLLENEEEVLSKALICYRMSAYRIVLKDIEQIQTVG